MKFLFTGYDVDNKIVIVPLDSLPRLMVDVSGDNKLATPSQPVNSYSLS